MCKSFSRGLSGDMGVTLGSRWLSSGLIVMGGALPGCLPSRCRSTPFSAEVGRAVATCSDAEGRHHGAVAHHASYGGAGQGVSRWTWHAGDHAGFESGLERRTV